MFAKWNWFVLSAAFLVSASNVNAQQNSANQTFIVRVPASIAITAPPNVSITHDQSDNVQTFPNQQWTVKGNVQNGVLVSFATNKPFTYVDYTGSEKKKGAAYQRDARLNLGLAGTQGPASWVITKPTATTNYLAGNGVATVQATSSGVGRATFNLLVSFITDSFGTFAAGDYETVVTGTVTAN